MRRFLFVLALLLVALQQQPADASVPRHNSIRSRSHAAPGRRSALLRASRRRPIHSVSHRRALGKRGRLAGIETLRHLRERGRQRIASLDAQEPGAQALIHPVPMDTVPLMKFRIPAAMKGSHDSLVRQNVRAEADGLLRIEDDDQLLSLRESKSLVAVPVGEDLRVDERLAANRRYCRQWTARFLSDFARVHYSRFGRPLQVNSAVRTVAFQRALGHRNGNAAAADGDIASPHLTGATIDLAKKGLSMQEIGWMRAYLLPLETAGKLDVEEEFHQACFHITVYKSYLPDQTQQDIASRRSTTSPALLAARVR